jgi:hypothetical protein
MSTAVPVVGVDTSFVLLAWFWIAVVTSPTMLVRRIRPPLTVNRVPVVDCGRVAVARETCVPRPMVRSWEP